MMISLLLLLFLIGNGASGFQASRQFETTIHPAFSPIQTVRIDTLDIQSFPQRQSRSADNIQRRASETSFSFTDALPSSPKSLREAYDRLEERYPWHSVAASQVIMTQRALSKVVFESWWIWPMMLATIPVYCAVFKGTCASMPHWWPVVRMDMIRQSKDAGLVISGFLLSNIAYFVSGGMLLQKFPFKTAKNGLLPIQPTEFTNLGLWILAAGTVSTIFHSVQALGPFGVAESLCYVDHGIAISACFYFLKTCGFPSRKVLTLGIAALATLVISHPCYAILHSTWHFLSATVATMWAIEGYDRMK
jgi:hypothetical protein